MTYTVFWSSVILTGNQTGTWRDAQKALGKFRDELAEAIPPSGYTFELYAEKWHEKRMRSGAYTRQTMRVETTKLKVLNGQFGSELLEDMAHDELQDDFTALAKRYSPKTMDTLIITFRSILQRAVEEGLLASNPGFGAVSF